MPRTKSVSGLNLIFRAGYPAPGQQMFGFPGEIERQPDIFLLNITDQT